jgi:hypothetical protein
MELNALLDKVAGRLNSVMIEIVARYSKVTDEATKQCPVRDDSSVGGKLAWKIGN